MAGGASFALSGLAAAYPGFVEGRKNENKADLSDIELTQAKRSELAKVAYGNTLAQFAAAQGPQAPPPGQPSQPMMQPGARPPMMPPQQPGMGGPPMPGGPPPGAPQAGGSAPPGGMAPPGGGMPPQMGGGQPQGRPGGQLDWRQLAGAVKQANPNAPPDVIAEAVNQFLPLMTQQSQMEWRQLSLQLREQSLLQREQLAREAERGRNERADTAETGRESRSERSDTRMRENTASKEQQFQQREGRLERGLKLREDTTWQRLEQAKQEAQRKVEAAGGKQGLAEWRAALEAQDKHVRQRIQTQSGINALPAAEKKKMLEEQDRAYAEQVEALRQKFGGRGTAAPGAPAGPKEQGQAPPLPATAPPGIAPPAPQAAPPAGAAPAAPQAPTQRPQAVNPQTGAKVEWDGKAWIPVVAQGPQA